VTKPSGFPHVDRAAQRVTSPRQFLGRLSSAASCATHRTYCPWVVFSSQGQRLLAIAKLNAAEEGASQPSNAVRS
jgi:hypothetical protein